MKSLLTIYQENKDVFNAIKNMGVGEKGELMVTYSTVKEKEAVQTLNKLKGIIDTYFPAESVEEIKKRREEIINGRLDMGDYAIINKANKDLAATETVGLSFVLPLVKNANNMVETIDGRKETFLEWVEKVLDYDIVKSLGTTRDDYLYVTTRPDTYEASKKKWPK